MKRRDFLKLSATTVGALGAAGASFAPTASAQTGGGAASAPSARTRARRHSKYDGEYSGERLNRVAFPMGGIGAGMLCLEGSGALSHVSLRHRPEVFHEPLTFGALCVKGATNVARVLQGPVPDWKKFGQSGSGNGAAGSAFGLPRFRQARCRVRFPCANRRKTFVCASIGNWRGSPRRSR